MGLRRGGMAQPTPIPSWWTGGGGPTHPPTRLYIKPSRPHSARQPAAAARPPHRPRLRLGVGHRGGGVQHADVCPRLSGFFSAWMTPPGEGCGVSGGGRLGMGSA